ncbi:hypothetical protein [Paenibacillus taichungensis]
MRIIYSEKYQCHGIFRAWRRHPKTNQILWAKNYGKKAWFIPLDEI